MDDTTWKVVANSSETPVCFKANIMPLFVRNSVPDANNDQHHLPLAIADFLRDYFLP